MSPTDDLTPQQLDYLKLVSEQMHQPKQPAEPAAPPAARTPETPSELLELLAGISSDPQVEGFSLAQKASTMALLYIAESLREISGTLECLDVEEIAAALETLDQSLKTIHNCQQHYHPTKPHNW